jgi:hypothetical protein
LQKIRIRTSHINKSEKVILNGSESWPLPIQMNFLSGFRVVKWMIANFKSSMLERLWYLGD